MDELSVQKNSVLLSRDWIISTSWNRLEEANACYSISEFSLKSGIGFKTSSTKTILSSIWCAAFCKIQSYYFTPFQTVFLRGLLTTISMNIHTSLPTYFPVSTQHVYRHAAVFETFHNADFDTVRLNIAPLLAGFRQLSGCFYKHKNSKHYLFYWPF